MAAILPKTLPAPAGGSARVEHARSTYPSITVAVFRFLTAMGLLFALQYFIDFRQVPDWGGYEHLYLRDGAWLRASGRDPVFVLLLEWAVNYFGVLGYETFRATLYGFFVLSIGVLAFVLPRQKGNSVVTSIVIVGFLLAAMYSLKANVQVREGLAFTLLLMALLIAYRLKSKWTLPLTIGLAIVASLIHVGMIFLTVATVLAWAVVPLIGKDEKLPFDFYWISVATSIVIGTAIAIGLLTSPATAFQYFGDVLVEGVYSEEVTLLKLTYWAILGGATFITHRQCVMINVRDTSNFGVAVTYIIACGLLPLSYIIPLVLTFLNFHEGSVIATFVRLWFTVVQVAIFAIVTARGANLMTLLIILFLLMDQIRIASASIAS